MGNGTGVFRRSAITALFRPCCCRIVTLSMPMSSTSVEYQNDRQYQPRSIPETFSTVRKKSPGVGCLNAQRCVYSRNARSNVARPTTLSRRSGRAPLQREGVDVSVEAFVLPGVPALVGADDHRVPLVPVLVIQRTEDRLGIIERLAVVHHHEHRVFHAADRTRHRRGLRIGIPE